MSQPPHTRLGGCQCGNVRFTLVGPPFKVGLCHCTSCRKETGSVAMAYAVWHTDAFTTQGDTRTWEGRDFCARCGTRLYSLRAEEQEVEVKLGALDDAPSGLVPTEELWVKRREAWMHPIAGAQQHREDPPAWRPLPPDKKRTPCANKASFGSRRRGRAAAAGQAIS